MLLYVDVIDACHLKCPTCVRGVRAFPNTERKLPLDTFRAIVAKARADGAYQVDMFNWIEPFLSTNLHEYVAIVKEAGLTCGISTTLSLPRIPSFEATLYHTDVLTVSISGFEQEIYEINHRGGNVDYVKANLESLAALKKSGRTTVHATLRMLMFDYNVGDEPKLRALAERLGLGFEVLLADGHPIRFPQASDAEREIHVRLARFNSERPHEAPSTVCPLIFEHVPVNAAGDVYQCSAYGNYEVMRIGHFLDLSREEILLRRYSNPVCNSCPWVRRRATPMERVLLEQAMSARLGGEVVNRVPALSGPLNIRFLNERGHLVQKSRQWENPPALQADSVGQTLPHQQQEAGPTLKVKPGSDRVIDERRTVRDLTGAWSDTKYLKLILKSVDQRCVAAVTMPGFPTAEVQEQFVGLTGEAALRDGYAFYQVVKEYCRSLSVPLNANTRVLDFGCGSGRILRFFFKDIDGHNIWGVDVDPSMVSFCASEMTCGHYATVNPDPPMSFMEGNHLDVIFAYSVFSHLAEGVARKWIMEFARVLKPGGLLLATTQGRGFLEACQALHDQREKIEFGWHRGLAESFQPIEKAREDYDRGRYLFSATGGGGPREPWFYGETLIPKAYIEREYTPFLALRDFIDDPPRQALFVMQKKS